MTKDEALRLALEALENSWTEPNNEQYEIEKNAITAIKKALETKDEPVAWMVWGHDNVPSLTFTKPADKYVFDSLYMIPPQRTWVGLTVDEIAELVCNLEEPENRIELGQKIEAKLKEKNT